MNPFLMSLFLSGPMPKNAHMAEGEQFREGLVASIAHFDRERAQQAADLAEQERQQVLALFPLESWGGLELQQYALGPEGRRSGLSFCRLRWSTAPTISAVSAAAARRSTSCTSTGRASGGSCPAPCAGSRWKQPGPRCAPSS